ncbi:MAG TPA: hypothetical protein PLQ56_19975 [Aggregatilineales bacterium]|nr:hypothetical protein [Aggregatilineales bacterium]
MTVPPFGDGSGGKPEVCRRPPRLSFARWLDEKLPPTTLTSKMVRAVGRQFREGYLVK